MRFAICSSILVSKTKVIVMMVEVYMSKTVLIIDPSTCAFIILMIFHIYFDGVSYKEDFIN